MAALKNKALKEALGLPDMSKANVTKEQEMVGKPVVTYAHKPRAPRQAAAAAQAVAAATIKQKA